MFHVLKGIVILRQNSARTQFQKVQWIFRETSRSFWSWTKKRLRDTPLDSLYLIGGIKHFTPRVTGHKFLAIICE